MHRTGFEDDHKPLFQVPHIVGKGPMPSTFPRTKFTTEFPKLKHPLGCDAAIHFATDPEIEKVALYPIEIPIRNGVHLVEFGLLKRDGRIVYVDVIPLRVQEEAPWIAGRSKRVQAEVARRFYHATYTVLDERSLHIEPRMVNLRVMFSHLGSDDTKALNRVREVIHEIPLPATIAEIREAADLAPLAFEYFDGHGRRDYFDPLEDVDRTFTALMQLATDGEIDIDTSRRFNDQTTVWATTRSYAYEA